MKDVKSKNRDSNFELLRLILMFLIIIHHSIIHGLGVRGLSQEWETEILVRQEDMLLCFIVNCLCIPSVNVFLLITGYYGLKSTFNKAVKLFVSVLFYTLIFTSMYSFIAGNYKNAMQSLMIFSHSPYWFIIDYFFLMCFTPMINGYCDKLTKNQFKMFIIALLLISCYMGFVWGNYSNINGYTLLQFMMMYIIGRYIKRFDLNLSKYKSLIIYFLCCISCGIVMYILYTLGKNNGAWHITYYNNPLIVLAAIALFLFFKNLHFSNKSVNQIALSSLAIYLFQSSHCVGHYMYKIIAQFYSNNGLNNLTSGGGIMLIISLLALITLIIAILIDQIQIRMNNKLSNYIKNRWFKNETTIANNTSLD